MGAVAAGLVGFFAFVILRITTPSMTLLFSELDLRDSTAIVRELENADIPYELRGDGTAILVPEEEVLRTRMRLAEDGLPAGGSMGYEIFDRSDALGTTSFVQNINHLRALEGELARTIRAIDRVSAARVHLVLPERQLFSREASEPTASIVLKTRGELDHAQIRAVQHLVASAVRQLSPSRVSIVDETGRLLASGVEGEGPAGLASGFDERRRALETSLQNEIRQIVSSVVGQGRSRVNVRAELNYNRVTQTSDQFDPEGRVVRSTQTREDTSSSRENRDNEGVSVGNELPAADGTGSTNARAQEQANAVEETVNYEISRTTRTEVVEAGSVKRISVAVLVDGDYAKNQNGEITYQPREQAQLDQIAALVRSAIGFSQERGDQVQIVNLRFAETPAPAPLEEPGGLFSFTKNDYFAIGEMVVLLIVSALVLLFVVRPLVRRIVTPEEAPLLAGSGEMRQIAHGAQAGQAGAQSGVTQALPAPDTSKAVELFKRAQETGQIHATQVEQVGEMVKNNPDEAVAIIRQWLGEAA